MASLCARPVTGKTLDGCACVCVRACVRACACVYSCGEGEGGVTTFAADVSLFSKCRALATAAAAAAITASALRCRSAAAAAAACRARRALAAYAVAKRIASRYGGRAAASWLGSVPPAKGETGGGGGGEGFKAWGYGGFTMPNGVC